MVVKQWKCVINNYYKIVYMDENRLNCKSYKRCVNNFNNKNWVHIVQSSILMFPYYLPPLKQAKYVILLALGGQYLGDRATTLNRGTGFQVNKRLFGLNSVVE